MKLKELNDDQRLQLKQELLRKRLEEKGESVSWGELDDAESLVTDQELEEEYGTTEFVPDDFS